jgi:hypothetical protein
MLKFEESYKAKTKKIRSGTMGGVITEYLKLYDNSNNVSLENGTGICVTIKTYAMKSSGVKNFENFLRNHIGFLVLYEEKTDIWNKNDGPVFR